MFFSSPSSVGRTGTLVSVRSLNTPKTFSPSPSSVSCSTKKLPTLSTLSICGGSGSSGRDNKGLDFNLSVREFFKYLDITTGGFFREG